MDRSLRLTRRQLLQTASIAALSLGTSRQSKAAKAARKPNILFLWTDQQRPDTMAVYGNRKLECPNLNKLASESVVFQSPCDTQPVCSPARSSILTGLWPHQTGVTANNIPLRPDTPCLPGLIADNDYRTGYFGKWHLGDEVFAQHGFEEWQAIEDGYDKHYSESRDRNAVSQYNHWLRDQGVEPDVSGGKFGRGFAARLPIDQGKPKFLELKARDFMRRHKDDPFVLHVNFLEPHPPYYGPLDDRHPPGEVDLPANFDDELEANEPLIYRALRAYYNSPESKDLGSGGKPAWRDLIAKYWGLVTLVDGAVGGILTELETLGLAEDTVVVYTSDHGDQMGSHRLIGKGCSYQESIGVPLLMRIPKQGRKQVVVDGPTSQIDVVPTLLDLIGKPRDERLPGKSLVPRIKDETLPADAFVQWHPNRGAAERRPIEGFDLDAIDAAAESIFRSVISPDGWKLTLASKDQSQLYNLRDDPGETRNLFGMTERKQITAQLSGRIHDWRESVNDAEPL